MKRLMSALVVLVLLTITAVAYAGDKSVKLEWDANTEENLAGYRVFCRQEGQIYNYSAPAWEGIETTCAISGLADDKGHYFVARAFDTLGNESGDSNEVGPPKAPCLLRFWK